MPNNPIAQRDRIAIKRGQEAQAEAQEVPITPLVQVKEMLENLSPTLSFSRIYLPLSLIFLNIRNLDYLIVILSKSAAPTTRINAHRLNENRPVLSRSCSPFRATDCQVAPFRGRLW